MTRKPRPTLLVLAGVNGAGKSSVAGERLRAAGLDYFNPDEVTRQLCETGFSETEANSQAWRCGCERLKAAISEQHNFAFETTLGGHTIPGLIAHACETHDVTIWFMGLDSPERHIERVTARVAAGGHAIPAQKIRERWDGARANLITLLPLLHELWVYDNSEEQQSGLEAAPSEILHFRRGRIAGPAKNRLRLTPDWAKPIVEVALRTEGDRHRGKR